MSKKMFTSKLKNTLLLENANHRLSLRQAVIFLLGGPGADVGENAASLKRDKAKRSKTRCARGPRAAETPRPVVFL